MKDETARAWFAPKRYGYGATPVTWQGWLATVVFVVACEADVLLFRGASRWVGIAILVVLFAALCRVKCNEPWRWRWGP